MGRRSGRSRASLSEGEVACVPSSFWSGGVEVLAAAELLIRFLTVVQSVASVTLAISSSSHSSLFRRIIVLISFLRLFFSRQASSHSSLRPSMLRNRNARLAARLAALLAFASSLSHQGVTLPARARPKGVAADMAIWRTEVSFSARVSMSAGERRGEDSRWAASSRKTRSRISGSVRRKARRGGGVYEAVSRARTSQTGQWSEPDSRSLARPQLTTLSSARSDPSTRSSGRGGCERVCG